MTTPPESTPYIACSARWLLLRYCLLCFDIGLALIHGCCVVVGHAQSASSLASHLLIRSQLSCVAFSEHLLVAVAHVFAQHPGALVDVHV